MPEDQGVNGDKWTEEVSNLLHEIGWNKVADSNIDIIGSQGIAHGIDSLYWYEDGFDRNRPKGVFLEAKRYATTSFQLKKLEDWVKTLNHKIRDLIMSGSLFNTYPEMEEAIKYNGVLIIWFHDIENYLSFNSKFIKAMEQINAPRIRSNHAIELNFYILENTKILELSSMVSEIKQIKTTVDQFNFYYPSTENTASNNLDVLNLEYIFSKFIFAKGVKSNGNNVENYDYVFYFGELTIESFYSLISILTNRNVVNSSSNLIVYVYKRDTQNFRKITPDIKKAFSEANLKNVEIKQLTILHDLPDWMVNN